MQNNLKQIRKLAGKTQKEVADYLGTQEVTYGRYENGTRKLHGEVLLELSNYFGCSIDAILSPRFDAYTPQPQFMIDEQLRALITSAITTLEPQERVYLYRLDSSFMELNFEGKTMLVKQADALVKSGDYRNSVFPRTSSNTAVQAS